MLYVKVDEEFKKKQEKDNLRFFVIMLSFVAFVMIFLVYCICWVDNDIKETARIIEHTKTTSFNKCMKTYGKKYIRNQGTFTLMQERKLNQNLENMYINGRFSSGLGSGHGEINTSYINKIYEPTEFERDNNWTNTCRKQKQVSEQVGLILKTPKENK